MCFVFIWEQRATCATYSVNWLVFITEMESVYCAVRNGSLNKAVCASSDCRRFWVYAPSIERYTHVRRHSIAVSDYVNFGRKAGIRHNPSCGVHQRTYCIFRDANLPSARHLLHQQAVKNLFTRCTVHSLSSNSNCGLFSSNAEICHIVTNGSTMRDFRLPPRK